ncbi:MULTISPECIES: glycosyltransferase [Flavobacterium]|nr:MULTISPECIES: glycosyltransferase [Flavobacterium]UOK43783.1 glycosyltransferase [Flavobacterium enshiense]
MKINPLVSVIMPVFNGSTFIEEAVKSVLNQTFIDFELIANA